ncbi:cytochrome P450 [Mycena sp. CBHHK59/15]|nr:cytochrome P450 [Mycena sp. CBHHK59/15]
MAPWSCRGWRSRNLTKLKYGKVFTFILLGHQGSNFVLGGKSTAFNAEGAYTHLTTPVFGKDVVYDVPNEVFMQQKKFVKFGLSTENFRAYVGMVEDEVEEFLKTDVCFRTYQDNDITILTVSRTLQGKEVRANIDKSFLQLYNDLNGGFMPLNFLFANLPLETTSFYVDIITKRKQNPHGDHEHDMIAALLDQKYRNGDKLRDHKIAHIMIALLLAGQHTSSATLSWTMLHLASRPDIAASATPTAPCAPWHEDLRHLPLLDSCVRETLRMHPLIHSIMCQVPEDVVVPASLAAPSKDGVYVIDPQIWKDSHTWNPTRWNDKDGVAAQALKMYTDEGGEKIDYGFGAVSKGTESPYQPFGAGKHRCIGKQAGVRHFSRCLELTCHSVRTLILMPKDPKTIHYRRRKFD